MPVTCHTQYDNLTPETVKRKQVTPTNGSHSSPQYSANLFVLIGQIIDNLIVSFDSKSVLHG